MALASSRHRDLELTDLPHHDGSENYVSQITPQLGETVSVRVRVPLSFAETSVHVRVVRDGEPRLSQARLVAETEAERWYEADVLVHNPVTNYRFFFARQDDYAWLNGEGTFFRDVPDASDFRLTVHAPAPHWLHEGVVYQIFPDRFARSENAVDLSQADLPDWVIVENDWNSDPIPSGPGVAEHFFGGDLDGIAEKLDYLKDLGVNTVYLTPVFPGRSNHRYDAATFDEVDPLLGGDAAYARLSAAVHERGMRLMGDITSNHTGVSHDWFRTAQADPTSDEHSFFYWTDEEPGYACWLEHPSLPKLNYHSQLLRERMIDGPDSVIGRWLQPPFSLDGWRVDVANMTGRWGTDDMTHDVARTIRTTINDVNPDSLLIAEHFHDASHDLDGAGWNGNMNYSAFTRPIWSWLADPANETPAFGLPAKINRTGGTDMVAVMRQFNSVVPFKVNRDHWNMLGSHDTPRLRTLVGDDMIEVALGLLVTYLGNPVIFAGDEVGLEGINGEHARKTMPWNDPSRWHDGIHATYRGLLSARSGSEALRTGGLRWVLITDETVAYVRSAADESVLVVVSRSAFDGAQLPASIGLEFGVDAASLLDSPVILYGSSALGFDGSVYELPKTGPSVHIWRLR
ncbi:glycoside hydrolase family 13 protein [Populibacterium corticicola]|uniref:Glycoside hydrolase family 13 protein n=1 Tax=Populibacterium corticicola TaxID=1812826 RepID=A0ABW5XEC5_9MICO